MTASTYIETNEETWRDAVNRLPERYPSPEHSTSEIADDLHQLIDTALDATNVSWEPGNQCPDCGGSDLSRWVSFPELTRHENGVSETTDQDNHSTVFAWGCHDCETIIAVSPAGLLLPVIEAETPRQIDALYDALDNGRPETEWRPGEPCSMCGEPFIGEHPIDVMAVTSAHGDYHVHHSGERITTVGYWCDSCGEPLQETNAGMLMSALAF